MERRITANRDNRVVFQVHTGAVTGTTAELVDALVPGFSLVMAYPSPDAAIDVGVAVVVYENDGTIGQFYQMAVGVAESHDGAQVLQYGATQIWNGSSDIHMGNTYPLIR